MKSRENSKADLQPAWEKALKLLAYKQRSEAELSKKLQEKGFDEETVCKTISLLKENSLLDDESFARNYALYRAGNHPVGRMILQRELLQRGIDFRMAEAVVNAVLTPEEEKENAFKAARRFRRRAGEDPDSFRRRLGRHLYWRGFDGDTIQQVMKALEHDIDSSIF